MKTVSKIFFIAAVVSLTLMVPAGIAFGLYYGDLLYGLIAVLSCSTSAMTSIWLGYMCDVVYGIIFLEDK